MGNYISILISSHMLVVMSWYNSTVNVLIEDYDIFQHTNICLCHQLAYFITFFYKFVFTLATIIVH